MSGICLESVIYAVCGQEALLYSPLACLLKEIPDSSPSNKADRQVVTDGCSEMDSLMRSAEQTSMVQPPLYLST